MLHSTVDVGELGSEDPTEGRKHHITGTTFEKHMRYTETNEHVNETEVDSRLG